MISIHLVTWNGLKYLKACLDSVFNQNFRDFSLLVIDNESQDGTVDFIKRNYPQVQVVVNKENLGFAQAHNQAIELTEGRLGQAGRLRQLPQPTLEAGSKYILVLNQDVILNPDFLKVAIKFMETGPRTAASGGKLLRWDFEGLKNLTKSDIIDSVGLKIFKSHRVVDRGSGEKDKGQYEEIKEVFGISGAVLLLRREALEDIKLNGEYFDPDFFSYKEDVDLACRLRLQGWEAWYLPQAVAYHHRSASAESRDSSKALISHRQKKSSFINYHSYKNHLFFLIKNVSFHTLFWYFPYIFWYEAKKLIYLIFFERATLKALVIFFKKLPKMLDKRRLIMRKRKVKAKEIERWLE